MRNVLLTNLTQAEPILFGDFAGTLDRLLTGLHVAANGAGLSPEGKARVKLAGWHQGDDFGTYLVGTLRARPADLPDPLDPWAGIERPSRCFGCLSHHAEGTPCLT